MRPFSTTQDQNLRSCEGSGAQTSCELQHLQEARKRNRGRKRNLANPRSCLHHSSETSDPWRRKFVSAEKQSASLCSSKTPSERKRATLKSGSKKVSHRVAQRQFKTFLWSVQIYLTTFVNSQDTITLYAWCMCLFDQEEPLGCERRIWTCTVSTACIKGGAHSARRQKFRKRMRKQSVGEWEQHTDIVSMFLIDSGKLGNPDRSPSAGWGWCCGKSEVKFLLRGFQSCTLCEMKKTCNIHPSCAYKCHQSLLLQSVNVSSRMPPALGELSDKLTPGNLDLKLCLTQTCSFLMLWCFTCKHTEKPKFTSLRARIRSV